jgi:hypothetical protein
LLLLRNMRGAPPFLREGATMTAIPPKPIQPDQQPFPVPPPSPDPMPQPPGPPQPNPTPGPRPI